MALELNGTTGVSLVQDGVVTAADLASGAITSGALPAGSVLQVVSTNLTSGTVTTTSSTPVSTGHSATITPSATSSKILVIVSCDGFNQTPGRSYKLRLQRNGTEIQGMNLGDDSSGTLGMSNNIVHLDSPATTSAVTYEMFYGTDGVGISSYNRANAFGGNTITLMEIAG